METTKIKPALDQFILSENYYKHHTSKLFYSDGIEFMASSYKGYWFIYDVLSMVNYFHAKGNKIITIHLEKEEDGKTTLSYCDKNANVLRTQEYLFTGFTLEVYMLFSVDGFLMLPCEYRDLKELKTN